MSATNIGPYHAGEVPPPVYVNFKDSTGAALDFSQSGPWTATFNFRSYGGAWITAAAVVDAGATGAVHYVWAPADLASSGDYVGEMWVLSAGIKYDSIRLSWQVLPSILSTPSAPTVPPV